MEAWKSSWAKFLIVMVALVPLALVTRSPLLLEDTDTIAILKAIESHHWSTWLTHDWPLGNHFYRPVSTALFQVDLARSGWNAFAFGFTNALLCSLSILGLGLLVEVRLKCSLQGLIASFAFLLLHMDQWISHVVNWLPAVTWVALTLILKLSGQKWLTSLALGCLAAYFLLSLHPVGGGTLAWIPGRTATSMTAFGLFAWALLEKGKSAWAGLCFGLALGCYEQALMLLPIFALAGIKGKREWAALLGATAIIVLGRLLFVPIGASAYQNQQLLGGQLALITLFQSICVPYQELRQLLSYESPGIEILLILPFYQALAPLFLVPTGWFLAFKRGVGWIIVRWVMISTIALGPMAFLSPFPHYFYLPDAIRILALLTLVQHFTKWLHPEDAKPRFWNRSVHARLDSQSNDAASVHGVNHAVIPQPSA